MLKKAKAACYICASDYDVSKFKCFLVCGDCEDRWFEKPKIAAVPEDAELPKVKMSFEDMVNALGI